MAHAFFREIDFDKLYRCEIKPPFQPKIKNKLDVSNFDTVFTEETAQVTPPDASEAAPASEKEAAFETF